jgi:hypothetical protein
MKELNLIVSIFAGCKFRQAENQRAYILIDRLGNGGKGSVVGLLKESFLLILKRQYKKKFFTC